MSLAGLKSAVANFLEGTAAAVLVVLAVLLLLGGATFLLMATDVKAKDWIEFIGLCLASLGSAISVLFGGIIRRQQLRDSKELERVKTQFASALAYYNARLSQITAREFEAYSLLWSALARFYRALYPLQTGNLDEDALKAAQKLCEEAEGHCLLVEEVDRLAFYAFWQRSRYIWGEAEKVKQQPDTLNDLWDQQIKGSPALAATPATATAPAMAAREAIEGYYRELELIKAEFYEKLAMKVSLAPEQIQKVFQT
jgi:hypothetical protein